MSSIAKAPWQVAFSACSAIVAGIAYASNSLLQISHAGDFTSIDTRISEYQAVSGLESASSVDVHEWMAFATSVFAVVATVFILLGILLWQGALRPGVRLTLTITALIAFIGSWNNFIGPLVVMRTVEMYTFPLALRSVQSPVDTQWGALMAGSAIAVIPLLILFVFAAVNEMFVEPVEGWFYVLLLT